MNKLEKIIGILALAAVVVASPYFIAKYKSISYANGQVILPSNPQPNIKAEDSVSAIISPDGKATLTMRKQQSKDSVSYTFSTDTGLNFNRTLQSPATMSVPFNTWSNDDMYLFLKEENNGSINYYVFSASGKPFADGSLYLNLTDIFAKKLPDFKLTEATGWAASTLIVLNTNTNDGKTGPSFWFELPTQNFIRLSSRFN